MDPTELRDRFELLAGAYNNSSAGGRRLVEWFREDWAMFSHQCMDDAHAQDLLGDIFDDGEIVRRPFEPLELENVFTLERWNAFRIELMHENRYFPKESLDRARLDELLAYLALNSNELPRKWYRARLQTEGRSFGIAEMGPPPAHKALHGRASPAGIPYLYVASNAQTAISEVRPHTGERATVAEFSLSDGLMFVDLRSPRTSVSPFLLTDEREIALLRGDINFLDYLGIELTRPVLPQSAAIDYIPSQYLCELIKDNGYHGVIYRSSVGSGINAAIFDSRSAVCENVREHQVLKVTVEIEAGS